MDTNNYEERLVKIFDAEVKQDFAKDDTNFEQTLHLLLQDIEANTIIESVLREEDVRKIIGLNHPLSGRQLIDFCNLLKQRDEPVKLMVPKMQFNVSAEDIINSKKLDPIKKKRRYYGPKKKYTNYKPNNRKSN